MNITEPRYQAGTVVLTEWGQGKVLGLCESLSTRDTVAYRVEVRGTYDGGPFTEALWETELRPYVPRR